MLAVTVKGPQDIFKINVGSSHTVADLKNEISKSKGYIQTDQKLLYSGRPLKDDQLLGKIRFDEENDFVVLVVSKPKKAKDSRTLSAIAEPSVEHTLEVASFITSPQRNELGNDETQVGIPNDSEHRDLDRPKSHLPANSAIPQSQPPFSPPKFSRSDPGEVPGPATSSMRTSNIEHVRRVIREDRSFRQYFSQGMAQQDPALAEQLERNPGFLYALLSMASNRPESGMSLDLLRRIDMLNVSENKPEEKVKEDEDEDAIRRLSKLGFTDTQAREAYLLSDKDEELAGNYLFAAYSTEAASDERYETAGPSFTQPIVNEGPLSPHDFVVQTITDRQDPPPGKLVAEPLTNMQTSKTDTFPPQTLLAPEESGHIPQLIQRLADLGFQITEDQATQALLACGRDEDLTVDYLITLELEDNTRAPQSPSTTDDPLHQLDPDNLSLTDDATVHVMDKQAPVMISPQNEPGESVLALNPNNHPDHASDNAAVTRQFIRESPEFRQHLVQSMVQRNPALGQMINENPDVFDGCYKRSARRMGIAAFGAGCWWCWCVGGEDREAVERLLALGFTHQRAIEAYLVCDKDEEVALNYLLDQ
ncbi:hypothetical protein CPB84DRAFT_1851464 [Gymnopilus junonius]|uniref:UV excision repair protein RAD23 n=1 Tax=Gymnopilus junonius TaxID=109634 RepID=A0A9P5THK9_GYMJU|nr:hypothetical protein CPB84DRAFT_1851464 [Gymnopilus junonius]